MNSPGPKEAGLYWLKPASYMIEYKELFKVFPISLHGFQENNPQSGKYL
jgi:hypothetical protein